VLHYGRKTTGIEPSYFMYGKLIEVVCFEKDLGVVFSNDMKVALHYSDSYRKAIVGHDQQNNHIQASYCSAKPLQVPC